MIATENLVLKQQVFDNIRKSVVKERKGIHLSDCIYCSRKAYFRKLGVSPDPSNELCLLWLTGYAFQAYMFPADKEITYNVDGVDCTPDIPSGIEVKSTRMSMAKFEFASQTHWKRQILGYCKALGKTEYDLVVMHVCGCLAPETQVLKYDLTWCPVGCLQSGDELVGVDEFQDGMKRRKLRKATVLRTQRIRLPCYRIGLSNGKFITASNEHPWLVARATNKQHTSPEWVSTDSLWVGAKLRKLCDISVTSSLTVTNGVAQIRTTNMQSTLKLLGNVRLQRLLDKLKLDGMWLPMTDSTVEVTSLEYIGEQEVIGMDTTTKTFIAEGIVTHNSYKPPFPDIACWHITATKEEIDANWAEVLDKAVNLEIAIATQVPPAPDCEDWEADYCENIEFCTDSPCYRRKQLKLATKK